MKDKVGDIKLISTSLMRGPCPRERHADPLPPPPTSLKKWPKQNKKDAQCSKTRLNFFFKYVPIFVCFWSPEIGLPYLRFIWVWPRYTQGNLFEILLNQNEIRLYSAFPDWFGTNPTLSVWFQINREMINTIWFHFYSTRFREVFFVCKYLTHLFPPLRFRN